MRSVVRRHEPPRPPLIQRSGRRGRCRSPLVRPPILAGSTSRCLRFLFYQHGARACHKRPRRQTIGRGILASNVGPPWYGCGIPNCYAFRHSVPCHSSQEALQCGRSRFSRAGSLNLGLGGAPPMKTCTRKSLGAVVLVISLLVVLGLYASGAPLLSQQESHSSSLPDGGVMVVRSFKLHWPLRMVCLFAFIGLIAFSWPARKPPRLEP